ncbi:MAG: right-handed parallel beta-helix repeat-containing protein [bacterium]
MNRHGLHEQAISRRKARPGAVALAAFTLALLGASCMPFTGAFSPASQLGYDVISRDTTWKRSSGPRVIDRSVLVLPEATLTVQPGAELVLGPDVTIFCQGRLVAAGSAERPIRIHGRQGEPWAKIDCFGTNPPGREAEERNVLRHCIVEHGRGIVARASALTVESCVFRNNASTPIRMEFSSGRIAENEIYDNSTELDAAGGNGGGIVAYTDKQVVIADNTIHDNFSSGGRDGGGALYAYAYDTGRVRVARNRIFRNRSDRHGGGIVAYSCDVEENWIADNHAACSGGGVYAIDARIRNNRIERNGAARGGGIYSESSLVERNAIVNNTAPPEAGGGLYACGDGKVLGNCFFGNGSSSAGAGEAIAVSGNTFLHRNNIVASRGLALRAETHSLAQDLDAAGNYWGTSDERMILARIHDWFDDGRFGLVDWKGFERNWVTGTPLPPPAFLLHQTRGERLLLSWEYPPGLAQQGFRLTWSPSPDFSDPGSAEVPAESRRADVPRPGPGALFVRLCALERAPDGRILEGPSSAATRVPPTTDGNPASVPAEIATDVAPACEPGSRGFVRLGASTAVPDSKQPRRGWWVVSEYAGDFFLPAFDSGPVTGSGAVCIPEKALQPGREYFWRSAFQDSSGNWSDWTPPTRFATPPAAPDVLAGPLDGSLTVGGEGHEEVSVKGNLLVPEAASLEILPGTRLRISPGKTLRVRGRLVARGEEERPVLFSGQPGAPWGQLFFEGRKGEDPETASSAPPDGAAGGSLRYSIVEHGHGILMEGSGALIQGCTVRRNRGSGISIRDAAARVVGNRIVENESPTNGGGIYAYGSQPVLLRDNQILNNRAAEDGGGVFSYGYHSTTAIHLEGNRIEGNRAGGDGAGVWASRSSVLHNRIVSNQAANSGGGLFATFALVEDNEIRANTALRGGGVYAETNSSVVDNRILENRALEGVGGGAYLNFWGVSVENEEFRKNLVSRNGTAGAASGNGGVYLNGAMIFEFNRIYGNDGCQLFNANPSDHNPLAAPHCYWGSSRPAEIAASIHDAGDDPALAQVDFEPFAASPEEATER